ncbi:MAG: hypothetical protein WCE46_03960 [Methanoregula sp.]|uniref:hypothetical protein n=1 Tax=Methanoregula sp. TaxID=2052170 RepID=UPI003C7260E8
MRDIAGQAGHEDLTRSSLSRHKRHLSVKLAKTAERREIGKVASLADDVLEQVKDLNARVSAILAACEADGDRRNAIAAIREARGLLETQGKLMGNFAPQTAAVQVNVGLQTIQTTPEWPVLMVVLSHHPEVHAELTAALTEAGL